MKGYKKNKNKKTMANLTSASDKKLKRWQSV